jgi:hypothetical protein
MLAPQPTNGRGGLGDRERLAGVGLKARWRHDVRGRGREWKSQRSGGLRRLRAGHPGAAERDSQAENSRREQLTKHHETFIGCGWSGLEQIPLTLRAVQLSSTGLKMPI